MLRINYNKLFNIIIYYGQLLKYSYFILITKSCYKQF